MIPAILLLASTAFAAPILDNGLTNKPVPALSSLPQTNGLLNNLNLPAKRLYIPSTVAAAPEVSSSSLDSTVSSLGLNAPMRRNDIPTVAAPGVSSIPTTPDPAVTLSGITEPAPVKRTDVHNEIPKLHLPASSITVPVIGRRLLNVSTSSVYSTTDTVLGSVLSELEGVESALDKLLTSLAAADVTGTLSQVESELQTVLNQVSSVVGAGGIDLKELYNITGQISDETDSLINKVQSLTNAGVTSDIVNEVRVLLADILKVVKDLHLDN